MNKPNVNHPVMEVDPSTNYYARRLRMTEPKLDSEVNRGFENTQANLFNAGKPTDRAPGDTSSAMQRRMNKAQC